MTKVEAIAKKYGYGRADITGSIIAAINEALELCAQQCDKVAAHCRQLELEREALTADECACAIRAGKS